CAPVCRVTWYRGWCARWPARTASTRCEHLPWALPWDNRQPAWLCWKSPHGWGTTDARTACRISSRRYAIPDTRMKQDNVIKILFIEDTVEDAEQVISLLRNHGVAVRPARATHADELQAACA